MYESQENQEKKGDEFKSHEFYQTHSLMTRVDEIAKKTITVINISAQKMRTIVSHVLCIRLTGVGINYISS